MSIKCGNHNGIDIRHETVADVKACYASPGGVADFAPTTEGVRFPILPAGESLAEINADQETWPWSHRKNKDQHPFDMGRRYAEAAAEIGAKVTPWDEPLQPRDASRANNEEVWAEFQEVPLAQQGIATVDRATEAQMSFIGKLLAERMWEPFGMNGDLAESVTQGKDITKREASALIGYLKDQPKTERPTATPKRQPWRDLADKVPAGYYGFQDAEGKNRFYRVSVGRNGYYKLQEQASSDLFEVKLGAYAGILQGILDFSLAKAQAFYGSERGRCARCNRELTDNIGNPYFSMGLGPECGGK